MAKRTWDGSIVNNSTSTALNTANTEQIPLLPEQATRTNISHDICSNCSAIDFNAAFSLTSKELGPIGKPITPMRSDLDPNCRLCAMIADALAVQVGDNPENASGRALFHLRACQSLRFLHLKKTKQADARRPSIVIIVVLGKPMKSILPTRINEAFKRGFIVHCSMLGSEGDVALTHVQIRGRITEPLSVDYAWITEKIQNCRFHSACKDTPGSVQDFGAYVIDCDQRRLTLLRAEMEYLALSYVWGPPDSHEGSSPISVGVDQSTSLPSVLPRTIEDAITVVKAVGKRYLWVDRHCIPTWCNKHQQILNMHKIYSNAIATIVAVDEDPLCSARSGLYGVSKPRKPQRRARLGEHEVIMRRPHVTHHISRSKWVTRGWTFQEARLSRRCLFFTADQVYFACTSNMRSEDLDQIFPNRPYGNDFLNAYIMQFGSNNYDTKQGTYSYNDYIDIIADIEQYSMRSLTYASDALNAFRGVLNLSGFPSVWGVSTGQHYGRDTLEFAAGLLWTLQKEDTRRSEYRPLCRSGFPTWSWISCEGRVVQSRRWFRGYFESAKMSMLGPRGYVDVATYLEQQDLARGLEASRLSQLRIEGEVAWVKLGWSGRTKSWLAEEGYQVNNEEAAEWTERKPDYIGTVVIDEERVSGSRDYFNGRLRPAVRIVFKGGYAPSWEHLDTYWLLLEWSGWFFQRCGLLTCSHENDKSLRTSPWTRYREINVG